MSEWRVFFEVAAQDHREGGATSPTITPSFDIWEYLGVKAGALQRAAPEERTDAYVLIPDARFGIKLRGGVTFEMKVRTSRDASFAERWKKIIRQPVADNFVSPENTVSAAQVLPILKQHRHRHRLVEDCISLIEGRCSLRSSPGGENLDEAAPTESLSAATTESLSAATATTESLSAATTESLSVATTKSLSTSTTKSLSAASTESLSVATTESLSAATTESLSTATTESLSAATTESLSAATTDSPSARPSQAEDQDLTFPVVTTKKSRVSRRTLKLGVFAHVEQTGVECHVPLMRHEEKSDENCDSSNDDSPALRSFRSICIEGKIPSVHTRKEIISQISGVRVCGYPEFLLLLHSPGFGKDELEMPAEIEGA